MGIFPYPIFASALVLSTGTPTRRPTLSGKETVRTPSSTASPTTLTASSSAATPCDAGKPLTCRLRQPRVSPPRHHRTPRLYLSRNWPLGRPERRASGLH